MENFIGMLSNLKLEYHVTYILGQKVGGSDNFLVDCGAFLFHTCGAAAGPEELKGVKLGRIGDRYLVKGSCTQNRKSLIRKKRINF